MVDDYMLNKALGKIKEIIGIQKFDYTNIWLIQMINFQMILLYDITFVILITCFIKDYGKFYLQIFLQEAFYV